VSARGLWLAALAASLACGRDEPPTGPATPAGGAAKAAATEDGATAPEAARASEPDGLAEPATAAAPAAALRSEQVATIDGEYELTWPDLDRYLGTVYARLPEGDDALQQLVTEAVIESAAAAAGVTVSDEEVAALEARLEAQAREASGGQLGLKESLGASVTLQDLRAALRLQALHEGIVRKEHDLPGGVPVDTALLKSWVEQHLPGDEREEPPLNDPLAVRWPGGEVTKAQVGKRLRSLLPTEDVSGVLTEMIGIVLVRREAARLGLELTPAEATREVLDRNAVLQAKAGAGDLTYDKFVQTVQKRSLKEVLASDQFAAEVLLRLISERHWTEDSARAEWEAHPNLFPVPAEPPVALIGTDPTALAPAPSGADAPPTWEELRATVWRALRQDCYERLFQQSRIVRRF